MAEKSSESLKKYIDSHHVDLHLKSIMMDCLKEKPRDILQHIAEFCRTKMRVENLKLENSTSLMSEKRQASQSDSSDESIYDSKSRENKNKSRYGVLAELANANNVQKSLKQKMVKKTDLEKDLIRKTIKNNMNFFSLPEKQLQIVIDAMEIKRYGSGEYVIKQGETGNEMFVVLKGTLVCTKLFAKQNKPAFVRKYEKGQSFGELSLMYQNPRAATIMAETRASLCCLDRETFNQIIRSGAIQYHENCMSMLRKIPFLQSLEEEELARITDYLIPEKFVKNDRIMEEGDAGDKMYFILEGGAEILKSKNGQPEKKVGNLKKYDFFGELALLKTGRREATVRVTSEEMIASSIDKNSFERLFSSKEAWIKHYGERYRD